ncbi:YggS family pyridoxal phosphate-dependent enzyme [Halothiobacillus sp.]|uniref:YggS family pyridoxal phosphate-dependent enzyme n=1 Tax=Halothiobacillus sp. TaxID=1891311 RepID=UPI0029854ED6|nr:YggS family pyridoxal phosphate-dependent enzyme [Halothiobacillus sp.]
MNSLQERFSSIKNRIERAARAAGRPEGSVVLIAVSKRQTVEAMAQLASLGQRDFGESYLQEALDKQSALAEHPDGGSIVWHFIGPIQSNKTRGIAEHFSWVHSVDRPKIAQRLNDQRLIELPPLNVLIEVNIDGEASKSGVTPEQLPQMVGIFQNLPRLRLMGLMAIPAPGSSDGFRRLAALNARLESPLPVLSMGMSDDFEAAIAAGSTHVRVGSALFGPRQ